jgi:hypothetical protein
MLSFRDNNRRIASSTINSAAVGGEKGKKLYVWGTTNSLILPYYPTNLTLSSPIEVNFEKLMEDESYYKYFRDYEYKIIHIEMNENLMAIVIETELPQQITKKLADLEQLIHKNKDVSNLRQNTTAS